MIKQMDTASKRSNYLNRIYRMLNGANAYPDWHVYCVC